MIFKCEWHTRAISFDGHDVTVGAVSETIEGVDVELIGGATQQTGHCLCTIGRTPLDLLPYLMILLEVNNKT